MQTAFNSHTYIYIYYIYVYIYILSLASYIAINVMYSLLFTKSSDMLNKNTYGAKKGEANQKQQLSDYTCD